MTQPDPPASSSPAFTRSAAILSVLAEQPQRPVGASELSRRTGVPKSTILNLCRAMLEERFIRRGPDGYQLNFRLAQLGAAYLRSVAEVEEFYALCRATLMAVPQTVQLAALGDGLNVVFLARHDGQQPLNLGIASEIGRSVPAHCTANGKALLAALDKDQLRSRLPADGPLPVSTPRSMSSPETLEAELRKTRERGYSVEEGEIVTGLCCYGIAVTTPHRADGLLGVSFTYAEKSAANEAAVPGELRQFAQRFATRIGGALAF